MATPLVGLVEQRQAGRTTANHFQQILLGRQLSKLQLSENKCAQESHTAAVTSIALDSEQKQYILTGLGDGTLCIHNIFGTRTKSGVRSKLELRIGKNSAFAHGHSVQTVSWYSDNGMFLTSGRDGKLKVWDSNAGKVVEQFKVGAVINKHSVAEPSVGALVAVANDTNHVQLVDLHTGSTCHTLRGHCGEILTCCWSRSDPRILATGAADKKIILWDVRQSRSFLASLDYNNVRHKKKKDIKLAGHSHQAAVHGLEYSSCGRYLFSLGADKRIRKWDTVTHKNLKTKFPEVTTKCKGSVSLCCTEGADRDIIYVPQDNNILGFNIMTGALVDCLVGHCGSVYCTTGDWERLTLFSGGRDRFILQWSTQLHANAANASKVLERDSGEINPYTVDAWSSDEEA